MVHDPQPMCITFLLCSTALFSDCLASYCVTAEQLVFFEIPPPLLESVRQLVFYSGMSPIVKSPECTPLLCHCKVACTNNSLSLMFGCKVGCWCLCFKGPQVASNGVMEKCWIFLLSCWLPALADLVCCRTDYWGSVEKLLRFIGVNVGALFFLFFFSSIWSPGALLMLTGA